MTQEVVTLTIDGIGHQVSSADCNLFAGRLGLDFEYSLGDGSLSDLPFGDAVEFSSLSGRTIDLPDCLAADYENPLLKPFLAINTDYYSVISLSVDSVIWNSIDNSLCLSARLAAIHIEDQRSILVTFSSTFECLPIDGMRVLMSHETLPIRFANRYLPLLGLPLLPDGPTRQDIIRQYGTPNDEGGGDRPQFGYIHPWIRYTLPNCFLRFQMDSDTVTHVTAMPRCEPLAPNLRGGMSDVEQRSLLSSWGFAPSTTLPEVRST